MVLGEPGDPIAELVTEPGLLRDLGKYWHSVARARFPSATSRRPRLNGSSRPFSATQPSCREWLFLPIPVIAPVACGRGKPAVIGPELPAGIARALDATGKYRFRGD